MTTTKSKAPGAKRDVVPGKMRKGPWSETDSRRLKKLRADQPEMTAEGVAERLGRTAKTVQTHAKRLGVPFSLTAGRPGTVWTDERKSALRQMLLDDGKAIEDVAEALGLPNKEIAHRVRREGDLPLRYRMDAVLSALWDSANVSMEEIAERCGVSRERVKTRAQELGLRPRARWAALAAAAERGAAARRRRGSEAPPTEVAPLPAVSAVAGQRGVPLGDLGPRDCRFAVSDHVASPAAHRFCGLPVAPGRSYCAGHAAAATVKTAKDEKKEGAAALADVEAERRERVAGRKRAA